MEKTVEKVINILKEQAELFLLDGKEFYPFGTYIDMNGKIIPVGASLGNDHPPSSALIEILENDFKKGIYNGDYKIAAIAIDIAIKEDNIVYDGIEIRLFQADTDVFKKYFKYTIKKKHVEFYDA